MKLWAALCTSLITGILCLFLAFFLVPTTRPLPAQWLYSEENISQQSDVILLFMGDAADRAPYAAKALEEGKANFLMLAETESDLFSEVGLKESEGRLVYRYLTEILHVPAQKIIFLSKTKSSSTIEESQNLLAEVRARKFYRLRLITSWYHSSRTLWIFRRMAKDGAQGKELDLASDPTPLPNRWYARESQFLAVFNEYLKWVYYYIRYELLR